MLMTIMPRRLRVLIQLSSPGKVSIESFSFCYIGIVVSCWLGSTAEKVRLGVQTL